MNCATESKLNRKNEAKEKIEKANLNIGAILFRIWILRIITFGVERRGWISPDFDDKLFLNHVYQTIELRQ